LLVQKPSYRKTGLCNFLLFL